VIPIQRLPYPAGALEPHLSTRTLLAHYQHYVGYVRRVNDLSRGRFRTSSEALQAAVRGAFVDEGARAHPALRLEPELPSGVAHSALCSPGTLYEQAAQALAHEEYFAGMSPQSGGPTGALADALAYGYGDLATARRMWVDQATGQFGSGWVWLAVPPPRAGGISTGVPAMTALPNAHRPRGRILTLMDVWEHAYYLDYEGDRRQYAEVWWDHLCDWQRADARFRNAVR